MINIIIQETNVDKITIENISNIIQEEIRKIENFKKQFTSKKENISRERIQEIIREEVIRQELKNDRN
jgi:hypothetical protein